MQETAIINVKDNDIRVIKINGDNYISLTDLARYANADEPKIPVYAWMRNKDVVASLGLWEQLKNEMFKGHEFVTFEKETEKKFLPFASKMD